MMDFEIQLFVAGDTPRSHLAASNVRYLLDNTAPEGYTLEIIDVLERPDLAEEHRILATPFVLKRSPSPARHVVGDLSDLDLAARALDLNARKAER